MVERERNEGRGFTFFHFMLDLEGGPCVAKRLSGCGSGTEYLAVTPWGDLYPCHQFVGDEAVPNGKCGRAESRQPEIADEFQQLQRLLQGKVQQTVLPDSTAAAAVWLILTNSIIQSTIPMMSAVRWNVSVWSARL